MTTKMQLSIGYHGRYATYKDEQKIAELSSRNKNLTRKLTRAETAKVRLGVVRDVR